MNGEILEVALLEQERKGQDMGVPNNYTGKKKDGEVLNYPETK